MEGGLTANVFGETSALVLNGDNFQIDGLPDDTPVNAGGTVQLSRTGTAAEVIVTLQGQTLTLTDTFPTVPLDVVIYLARNEDTVGALSARIGGIDIVDATGVIASDDFEVDTLCTP